MASLIARSAPSRSTTAGAATSRSVLRFSSTQTTQNKSGLVIAIRREDPSRIWERRCPITPRRVRELVEQGHTVVFEECTRRIFSRDSLASEGAIALSPQLFKHTPAHITIGIKETPLHELQTSAVPTPTSDGGDISLKNWTRRTHVMFSHTAKGQPYNTPLLAKFLTKDNLHVGVDKEPYLTSLSPRLIDYELLTEEGSGRRTVAFGWYAGVAGVLEALSSMAHAHLEIGIASPFLYTPRPHTHPSLTSLRHSLRSVGKMIKEDGTPPALGPIIIGLTGNGNVSSGCLSMLSELPIQYVQVKDLDKLVKEESPDLHKIYLCHALPREYLTRLDGGAYDRQHYYQSPQSYRSDFAEKVAPYLTLFLNGTGWQPSFPRLMTNEQLEVALYKAKSLGGARFTNIGDISCDLDGGLEFMKRSSTISSPFYKIQPSSPDLPPVQIMSVDILPASIPLDASEHFSDKFFPYLQALVREYVPQHPQESHVILGSNGPIREELAKLLTRPRFDSSHTSALQRATIAQGGELEAPHRWLREGVNEWRKTHPQEHEKLKQEAKQLLRPHKQGVAQAPERYGALTTPPSFGAIRAAGGPTDNVNVEVVRPTRPVKKRMLMLGSGMVAGPAVDEIAKRSDIELIIASNSLREVEALTRNHLNIKYRLVDMSDMETVDELIQQADVVISLLPAMLHPKAAELCIKHKKHLVTASYISPEMKALHTKAVEADVLLLNEIGLDPGIDHCSAIDLIDRLQSSSKSIKSFISFCGGLPAPDVPHVPFRYKFSWSPRGVLSAATNSARYKLNNQVWSIPGENILKSYFPDIPITDQFDLEGIANRDSLPYLDTYNLGKVDGIRTVLRGTLRYPGFSSLMDSFKSLGLLESQKRISIHRWSSLIPQSLATALSVNSSSLNVGVTIKGLISQSRADDLYTALEWLGLLPSPKLHTSGNETISMPPIPREPMTPIDLFSALLAFKLRYNPGERDMVVMSHEIIASKINGSGMHEEEVHTSNLIVYGTPKASAMALTVGLPVAFAALHVIDGKVALRGVSGPGDKSIYRYILGELERVGLGMKESVRIGGPVTVEKALMPISL
ncbi:hypothetical protein ONZ45_g1975 [Pleurotus djamor]|nr:hypothetical protein ONZ45_g1975 [Pleurotus djamor]